MRKLRVLIADDHDMVRSLIVHLVSREYDVVGTASNGFDAIDSVASLGPDIVVLDISMPGLTGIEVACRLRDLGSGPKILFLSSYTDCIMVDAALATGASGYVSKPRAAEELIPAIRAVSDGRTYWSASVIQPTTPSK